MLVERTITEETLNYAKKKLATVTKTSDQLSKFGSERTRIYEGYIGEKLVMDLLKIEDHDTFDYDTISRKGKKIDIKTVSCKSKPLPHYLVTVNSHDLTGVHKQKADYYIFVRITEYYTKGWILGYMPCDEFWEKGTFVPKGTDFGPFQFEKANATVMEIKDLYQFEKKMVDHKK